MKTYSTTITKAEFVKELKKHQGADAFIKGTYGDLKLSEFKGCAVGCSLESISRTKGIKLKLDNHQEYETHLGIPEWLARLEDKIFEDVGLERSKTWPVEFAEAINEGVDLDKAKTPFLIAVLEHSLISMDSVVYDKDKFPDVEKAILQSETAVKLMIEAHRGNGDIAAAGSAAESAAWSAESAARSAGSAARSAESAAWSAGSAARSAARSARSARSAGSAAESAAWSAAWSAESARSAESAAGSAARSARSAGSAAESAAGSAESAESAARSAALEYYADCLLDILREIK